MTTLRPRLLGGSTRASPGSGGYMHAELSEAIRRARIEVLQADSGHLELPFRDQIWAAMGPYEMAPGNRAVRCPGLIRRTRLCVLCVQRVLPIFSSAHQAANETLVRLDDEPGALMEYVQGYLEGRYSWDEAWSRSMSFGTMLRHDYELMSDHVRAALVLHASGAALGTALKDMGEYGGATLDRDLDAWDADAYACWAEVGVEPWKPSGAVQRRTFWIWYLDNAVPAAFESA